MKKRAAAVLLLFCFLTALWMPTAAAAEESEVFLALFDINGDGNVTTGDARDVLRAAVGLQSLTPTNAALSAGVTVFGDCDGNSDVTTADARLLLRYAVGLCEADALVYPGNAPGDGELVDKDDTTKPDDTTEPDEPAGVGGFDPSALPVNTLLSPKTNHGLGTSRMIVASSEYAETTPAGLDNLLSNALNTPYIRGTVDYVTSGPGYYNEESYYRLQSGAKIELEDVEYLASGYRLPDNQVQLMGLTTDEHETALYFKTNWQVPVCFVPETDSNYSGRELSGSFDSTYIDLRFFNTAGGSGSVTFPAGSVFSSASWRTASATKVTTLRLNLAEPGAFYGCMVTMTDNGYFRVIARNKGEGLAGKTIVLDPGHGGSDPGGGAAGVYEEPINLGTAQYLKTLLEGAGATVVMTRTGDTNVSLDERNLITRREEADLFISLHCDVATGSPGTAGVSVYYFYPWAKPYAQSLQDGLVDAYRGSVYSSGSANYSKVDRGIRFYAFQVARSEGCPAVLIELGFMTNATERAILQKPATQQALAQGIYNGLVDYYA